jgi:hypothetical protein
LSGYLFQPGFRGTCTDDLRARIDATKVDADAMRDRLDLIQAVVLEQKVADVQQGRTAAEPADGTKARAKPRGHRPGH